MDGPKSTGRDQYRDNEGSAGVASCLKTQPCATWCEPRFILGNTNTEIQCGHATVAGRWRGNSGHLHLRKPFFQLEGFSVEFTQVLEIIISKGDGILDLVQCLAAERAGILPAV
jgi:hypothetical protein